MTFPLQTKPDSLEKEIALNGGRHDDELKIGKLLENKFDNQGEEIVLEFSLVNFVQQQMRARAKHFFRVMRQSAHHVARSHEEDASAGGSAIVLADPIPDLATWIRSLVNKQCRAVLTIDAGSLNNAYQVPPSSTRRSLATLSASVLAAIRRG